MKYPKRWEAESRVNTYSRQTENGPVYGITLTVYRPGTPHHGRRICSEMPYGDMVALRNSIGSLIETTAVTKGK